MSLLLPVRRNLLIHQKVHGDYYVLLIGIPVPCFLLDVLVNWHGALGKT